MRVRTQGSFQQVGGSYGVTWENFNGSSWVPSTGTWSNTCPSGQVRTIWDVERKKPKEPFLATLPCSHLKVSSQALRYSANRWYESPNQRISYSRYMGSITDAWLLSQPTIPDLSLLHLQAMDFFRSGCQDMEVDLGTNFLELPEIKDLWKFLKDIPASLRNLRVGTVRKRVKKGLDLTTNSHLAYSFGFAPLISDFQKSVMSLISFHEKLLWLRENQGKLVKVSYTQTPSVPSPAFVDGTGSWYFKYKRTYVSTYRAYALMSYNLADLNDAELAVRLFLRRFNLDNPLGILWERIPFSFVIDWFLGIGGIVSAVPPKIVLPTYFKDIGYTFKSRETYEATYYHFPAYGANQYAKCQSVEKEFFTRSPALNVSLPSVDLSLPGMRQLWLGISLLYQRYK